jgi:hypothetical protein
MIRFSAVLMGAVDFRHLSFGIFGLAPVCIFPDSKILMNNPRPPAHTNATESRARRAVRRNKAPSRTAGGAFVQYSNQHNREEWTMTRDCTNGGCACTPNQSIKCTVNNCAHHCQDTQYCGLNTIQVGTHETNPTMVECTDCQSFKLK